MMRNLSDSEKDIANKVARRLIKHVKSQPWFRRKNEAEFSLKLTEAVNKSACETGIPAPWLKSFMMRIERGDC